MRQRLTIVRIVLLAAIAAGCWVVRVAPLQAGNPLQTNDSETPGANGWEVNVSHNLRFTPSRFTQHLPLLDFNYGHVDNDQWKVSIPVLQVDPEPGNAHWGVGDIQLGWKYRFLEEDEVGLMASIYPQSLLPTGNEQLGLGNGRGELFFPVEVGKHFFDDTLFVYGEAGHNFIFEDRDQDTWFFGLAAEWQVSDKIELVGEIAEIAVSRHVGPDEPFFNIGLNYEFTKHIALQTAFGRSLVDEQRGLTTFNSYVGLHITWGGQHQDNASAEKIRKTVLARFRPRS